jgi:hypothetical protein
MYALNASTGEHIWQEKIFTVLSSAAVSEGVVYVGGFEYVYALNATTGSQIWVFPTQNQINSSPAVFDGVIYIGSQDGNFYAIGEPIVGPKPFPVVWITAALGVVVAVVGIGLLVYFKKRGRTPH